MLTESPKPLSSSERASKGDGMKALVLTEYDKFRHMDVPEPEVGPDDVLLRVKACGIAGSDVHGVDGSTGRRQPAIIMGHEPAGVICGTETQVQGWHTGQRVAFDSTIDCGSCFFCKRGQVNLCDNRRVAGVSCDDYRHNGALADYIAVPSRILYLLPDGLSFDKAAMTGALSVAFHTVGKMPITTEDTAVVGAGIIGLLLVQTLRRVGCRTIVSVDVDDTRLGLSTGIGADTTINSAWDDAARLVFELTSGRSADVMFDAVGIPQTVEAGVAVLRKGGKLCLIGNVSQRVEIPLQTVVNREIDLPPSCASSGEYPAWLEALAAGKIDVDGLISATPPLSEGQRWFDRLHAREAGLMKVIFKP